MWGAVRDIHYGFPYISKKIMLGHRDNRSHKCVMGKPISVCHGDDPETCVMGMTHKCVSWG